MSNSYIRLKPKNQNIQHHINIFRLIMIEDQSVYYKLSKRYNLYRLNIKDHMQGIHKYHLHYKIHYYINIAQNLFKAFLLLDMKYTSYHLCIICNCISIENMWPRLRQNIPYYKDISYLQNQQYVSRDRLCIKYIHFGKCCMNNDTVGRLNQFHHQNIQNYSHKEDLIYIFYLQYYHNLYKEMNQSKFYKNDDILDKFKHLHHNILIYICNHLMYLKLNL